MFIEPTAQRTLKLQRSETLGFRERHIALLSELRISFREPSYKHLAALRPGH